jgi:T5orf172 domain
MPDPLIPDPEIPEQGPCWYVYLLSLADCSAFKVGYSCNPLQRIYGFNRRYFERFDLHESQLLQVRSLADARAIEATLKSELAEFRADCPAWVAQDAGGQTDWFSAVYFPQTQERLQEFFSQYPGAQLVALHELISGELGRLRETFELWAWSQAQHAGSAPAHQAREAARLLQDWLDAYRILDIPLFVDDPTVRDYVNQTCGRRH